MTKKIILGTGVLNWNRDERVTDRYGTVKLYKGARPDHDKEVPLVQTKGYGKLCATVLETRDSYHQGDWIRGLSPGGAKMGMTVVLGTGTIFSEGISVVGLAPLKKRYSDWLNPRSLYKLHHQTVSLWFVPMPKPKRKTKSVKKKTTKKVKKSTKKRTS